MDKGWSHILLVINEFTGTKIMKMRTDLYGLFVRSRVVNNKEKIKKAGWLLFILYIAMLVYFLFFSERYGRTAGEEYRYNIVLFAEIKRFFKYRHLLSTESFLLNMFGNIIGFMPFGFFVPMLSKKHSFWRILCLSFELTLAIEVTQLFLKVGIFDVDDLFLNTLGGVLGYLCYLVAHGIYRSHHKRSQKGIETKNSCKKSETFS